jgi:uncharacterized hydrophobic protein (TIGR00271 family)
MVKRTVVTARDAARGVLTRLNPTDLTIIGFTKRSELERWMFGDLSRELLNNAPGPVVMVARSVGGDATPNRIFRRVMGWIHPALTRVEQDGVVRQATDMSSNNIDYTMLILTSATIATLGLMLSSPAVIIGAMLVAPLMQPLIGVSVGITTGSFRLTRQGLLTLITGILGALLVAIIIGVVTPTNVITPEMAARGSPSLLDAVVAIASGIIGAYATARKDIPSALAGVAIAAALVPPLCTIGLGLAFNDVELAYGATVLFATNIVAIILAGSGVFLWLGMSPRQAPGTSARNLVFAMAVLLIAALAVTIGLVQLTRRASDEAIISDALEIALEDERAELVSVEIERESPLHVIATVRSATRISPADAAAIEAILSDEVGETVELELVVLQLVLPPQPTPQPTPTPTANAGA